MKRVKPISEAQAVSEQQKSTPSLKKISAYYAKLLSGGLGVVLQEKADHTRLP